MNLIFVYLSTSRPTFQEILQQFCSAASPSHAPTSRRVRGICSGQDSDPHKIMTRAQATKSLSHLGTIPGVAPHSEDIFAPITLMLAAISESISSRSHSRSCSSLRGHFRPGNSDASRYLGAYPFSEPFKAPIRRPSGACCYSAIYS